MAIGDWTPPAIHLLPAGPADVPSAERLAAQLTASAEACAQIIQPAQVAGQLASGSSPRSVQRGKRETAVWQLHIEGDQRELVRPDGARTTVDFTRHDLQRRSQQLAASREPLLRALGIVSHVKRHGRAPGLLDTTAGFGIDAWLAATAGCRVRMLERSALMAELLEHALQRARDCPQAASVATRVALIHTDAVVWLAAAEQPVADVIYLDPMFPARRKSARVKKGMQFLHGLLAPEPAFADSQSRLLELALQKAGSRVVVKRPRGAPPLNLPANWAGQLTTIDTSALRYDVHHLHG